MSTKPNRIRVRALRGGLLADARRTRRGHLHRPSADSADRGARSPHAFPARVYAPDLLGLRIEFPDDLQGAMDKITLDVMELGPGEKAAMSLTMPAEFGIIFDPVTHTAVFLDVAGEPTTERRNLSVVLSEVAIAPRTS